MDVSIKRRISWSFALLVSLFVINGIITIVTLNSIKKLSTHLTNVVDPSINSIYDFRKMLFESKMYTTDWVYLRSNQEDKEVLKKIHSSGYKVLKGQINIYADQWENKKDFDSLNKVFAGFEQLLAIEKNIMGSLRTFEDYDDPVLKFEAERKVEEEILPRTAALLTSLNIIINDAQRFKKEENTKLEHSSMKLSAFIIALAVTIICIGFFLSLYMTKIIISPIKKIRQIINDLGQGIVRQVNHKAGKDEIGDMVHSVNNLSTKLQATAKFAQEVGLRNFDIPFQPLSNEDTLGTALIAMRDNIKSSYQKLNEAQNIAKLGSWEWNLKNVDLFWSEELFSIFNHDPKVFIPSFEAFLNFVHPNDRDRVNGIVTKCLTDKMPFTYECRIISNTGISKIIFAQGKVSTDDNGEIIKMSGIAQDITERKKAEMALFESQKQIQTIYDAVLDAVFIIDEEGKIVKWDSKSEALFGWKQDELLGTSLTEAIIPHQHREAHTRGMKHFLKTGEGPELGKTIEVRALNKSNVEFDISLSISPSFINGKYQFIGFIRDITSRKKAELDLQKSEAFLEMKNKELEVKNRELEQFAYVASHDLQEPLRTTSSFADLLQKQYSDKLDEKANKYLSFITHSSDRMKVFIKDLLDYSRIGRQKEVEKIDCNIILTEVIEDLNKLITDEKAVIQAGPLPVVSGYQTEIQQLFQNLLMNAIKFRKKNTTPQIQISANLIQGYWEFAFKDNGIGIEQKHNERIFIIFQRLHTRGEYQGSGIGLSHCKKIVELHGGKIWVNSTPGEGSIFNFTIPATNVGLTNGHTKVPGMYMDIHQTNKNATELKFYNGN
ncbi:MAG: PAS domain S-box protein [Ginsengibacter sp.]